MPDTLGGNGVAEERAADRDAVADHAWEKADRVRLAEARKAGESDAALRRPPEPPENQKKGSGGQLRAYSELSANQGALVDYCGFPPVTWPRPSLSSLPLKCALSTRFAGSAFSPRFGIGPL